jgi:hypothetical protein
MILEQYLEKLIISQKNITGIKNMDYLTQYYKNLAEQLKYKLENLTVQLNEKRSYPSWLKNDEDHPQNIHNEIGSRILELHVNKFPHINRGNDRKLSLKDSFRDFEMKFDSHPDAPFTNPSTALEAMAPHIMFNNSDFEQHVRETLDTPGGEYGHPDIGTLTSEHIDDLSYTISDLMQKYPEIKGKRRTY